MLPSLPICRIARPPPPLPVPAFSWTGFYIGVNASGVVDGDFSAKLLPPLPAVAARVSAAGYVAGGTVGFNYQFTPGSGFVVGLEGDVGYSDIPQPSVGRHPRRRRRQRGGRDRQLLRHRPRPGRLRLRAAARLRDGVATRPRRSAYAPA